MVDIQALVFDWGDDVIRAINRWTDEQDKVREKLRNYRSLVSQYRACKELYESLYPSTTSTIKEDTIQAHSEITELERVVSQRIDLKQQMNDSLQEMADEIGHIMSMIKSLPPDEYTIVLRRYTLAQSMEDISEVTFISVRQCWEYHRRAIIRLAE